MLSLLILSMVLSAAIVNAADKTKKRSRAAWDDMKRRAEERGAAREKARQQASQAWEQRLQSARTKGPSDPLWWAYGTGYALAGVGAALAGGVTGATTGFVSGIRTGYELGREGGKQGWKYAETWAEWRRRHIEIQLLQCTRCGGYTTELTDTVKYGQVCSDCVPSPSTDRTPEPHEDDEDSRFESTVIHDRTGNDKSLPPKCANRCGFLAAGGTELCAMCQIEAINRRERAEEHRKEEARRRREEQRTATPTPPSAEPQEPNGPIRVKAERIYPEPKSQPQPKEIENTMTAIESANSNSVDDSAENYDSTVAGLESLARLMKGVLEKVNSMNESLTAASMDADTLNRLSELTDGIESVEEQARGLHRHVENRHSGLASATAEAGGSQNVATKTYYD